MDRLVSFLLRRLFLPGLAIYTLAFTANAASVTFVGDFSYMSVGTIRPVRLYVQNSPEPNRIEIFLVRVTSSGELSNGLGLSFNMFSGPYEQEFAVRVNTDSFGNGYSEQFYMKSLASVSPLKLSTCGGPQNAICGSVNIGAPPGDSSTTNPPPSVTSIGVGEVVQYWLVTPQPVAPEFRGYTVTFVISPTNSVGAAKNASSQTWGASIGVDMYIDSSGNGRSETFYLKGRSRTAGNVYLPASSDNHFIAQSQAIAMKVVQVSSITWSPFVPEHPIDGHRFAGGGKRHFADKNTATETQESRWRNVEIKLKLSQSVANMIVRVKVFDVDDPSTSIVIDPNGVSGGDNRETVPLYIANLTTDSTGAAAANFRVSSRPGDNYRVAATVTSKVLTASDPLRQKFDSITTFDMDSTRLRVADGPVIAEASPESDDEFLSSEMLTIWRRLNLEKDAMGPIAGNYAKGSFASAAAGTSFFTTTFTLDAVATSLEVNRFEGGLLELREGPSSAAVAYEVISNTARTVTVQGFLPTIGFAHDLFLMYDDDDIGEDDAGSLDGDQGESLPGVRDALIQSGSDNPALNVFAPAFIEISNNLPGSERFLPFKANRGTEIDDFDNILYEDDPNFWTIYLLDAYQEAAENDGDPITERLVVSRKVGDSAILIFEEVYTESERRYIAAGNTVPSWATRDRFLAQLVASFMGAEVEDGGLMSPFLSCVNCKELTSMSIAKIRSQLNP